MTSHIMGCKLIGEQTPEESCWPSTSTWNTFNISIGGNLIADVPPALPCYPGPAYNAGDCAAIDVELTNQTFISNNPIALSYPTDSCPAVNSTSINAPCTIGYQQPNNCSQSSTATLPAAQCSLGDQPVYTVNATETADLVAGIRFAREKGIRLVVRNTGHDLLRR